MSSMEAPSSHLEAFSSAPGKLILFGEHAVVYGHTAVAAALSDLRIRVHATTNPSGMLHASLPDLPSPICLTAPLHLLKAAFSPSPPSHPRPPTPEEIASLAEALSPYDPSGEGRPALLPLLFLSLSLLPPSSPGLSLTITSHRLPVGAGLGSSAAFAVALAAALLRLHALSEGAPPLPLPSSPPPPETTRLIDGWAFAAECISHGNPSGLDSAVSCAGGTMRLSRPPPSPTKPTPAPNPTAPAPTSSPPATTSTSPTPLAPPSFERVTSLPSLTLLLINTRVPRATKEKVASVRRLRDAHPSYTSHLLSAIGAIAEEFLQQAGGGGWGMEGLGWLVESNHLLLRALGVSCEELEAVVRIGREEGLPSKLTGAGGGGCAFSVVGWEEVSEERANAARRARAKLERAGFDCFESVVGGEGVLWHSSPPARKQDA